MNNQDARSQPRSTAIVEDIRKSLLRDYDEGAITASEFLLDSIVKIGNWEQEVIAEHNATMALQPSWLADTATQLGLKLDKA